MRNFCFALFLAFVAFSCMEKEEPVLEPCLNFDESVLDTDQSDFFQIVFGSEFGSGVKRVRKWEGEILIFVPQVPRPELKSELLGVMQEINLLSESIKLREVNSEAQANYIFFFGSGDDYVRLYESSAADLIDSNRGLFSVEFSNQSFEILRGTAWVDTESSLNADCLRHLIREELTQSLGMVNDIASTDQSIFERIFTCTQGYSERDEDFIRFFLSEKIKPGLCQDQVFDLWNE
ncbi:DUF2927 domain-containing protein [Algoriphagus namhaensis]